jgi:F420-0:gamma-glutamyl ligase
MRGEGVNDVLARAKKIRSQNDYFFVVVVINRPRRLVIKAKNQMFIRKKIGVTLAAPGIC